MAEGSWVAGRVWGAQVGRIVHEQLHRHGMIVEDSEAGQVGLFP